MNRIATTLKKKSLITFIMAGDPDYKTSLEIMKSLPKAGSSVIEIGMPFSDPMADGPAIQAAGKRAINAGMTLTKTLQLVKDFRKTDDKTPVILMGYLNPILFFGYENFASTASKNGVDGVIIVDVPPEEDGEISPYLKKYKIDQIRLIAPTSDEKRIKKIAANASGFLYYVSIAGITGTKSADLKKAEIQLRKIRKITKLPIAVGFGINDKNQVVEVLKFAGSVVVGSALVKIIASSKTPVAAAKKFVSELASAL